MKAQFIVILLLVTSLYSKAQEKYKVYYEKAEYGYDIFVDNNEFCPISIKLNFKITNLSVEKGNNKTYVIKPNAKKELVTKLIIVNKRKRYKFSYSVLEIRGDVTKEVYDKEYKYFLPFGKGNTFLLFQGYNGSFSHQNENALDFTMPVGTEITAVRDGVVVDVVQKNTKNCGKKECAKYNNFIIIYHKDGTFAEYTHIRRNGSNVKVGDVVKKGQKIGFSGNVGWSTGPHLHLVIYLQKMDGRKTVKTKFIINKNKLAYLKEKEYYKR